jgi:hypothetical protein
VVEGVVGARVGVLAVGAGDGGDGGSDGLVLRDEGDGRADVDAEAVAMPCEMATSGLVSLGCHQAPSTMRVPAGTASFQVRLTERRARRGKFLSLRSAAATPSTESMRAVAMGRSSGSAVTEGWVWSSWRTPAISESAMSMRKTLGRLGAAEMFISLTASFCTR